jgi:chemotaxis protein CheC
MKEGSDMEKITMNDMQKDALQEVANIGASHAATALSQMISRDIQISVPKVDILPLENIVDCVKDEKIGVGIFLKISDQIPSYVLLLLPKKSAFALADLLLGKEPTPGKDILSEMDSSALQEVANVMMCAFFDSVTALLGIPIVPGPPALAFDEPVAVMDYVLIQIGEVANEAVVFNVELQEEKGKSFDINMFLLPEPQSVTTILEKLGMKCTST